MAAARVRRVSSFLRRCEFCYRSPSLTNLDLKTKFFMSAHAYRYRKALRFMRHAEKFGFPILTFIDTPGAYAGVKAEELGQVC